MTTRIIINFDSEKLSAIQQFSEKDAQSVETQILEHIEKIYQKIVPAPVRQYIENKPKSKPNPRKKPTKPSVSQ